MKTYVCKMQQALSAVCMVAIPGQFPFPRGHCPPLQCCLKIIASPDSTATGLLMSQSYREKDWGFTGEVKASREVAPGASRRSWQRLPEGSRKTPSVSQVTR